jgi:hypothetical protein
MALLFLAGFFYCVTALVLSEANPLKWHPVIYTLFFEVVLLMIYISYRAVTDKDDLPIINDIY